MEPKSIVKPVPILDEGSPLSVSVLREAGVGCTLAII